MFWNDIEDIKKTISEIKERLNHIDRGVINTLDVFCSESDRLQEVRVAEKTMEKFEDYMKNVDKLNTMINEFKGCVSMARGAISEGKDLAKDVDDMKGVAAIARQIYQSMNAFIKAGDNIEQKAYFKIDAIYKEICEYHVKKRRRRRKKKSCSTPSTS